MILKGEYLWVYDRNRKLVMKVKRSFNRLYKIIIDNNDAGCLMSKSDENSWLWHARLGHVNFKAMTLMHSHKMIHGLPEIKLQGGTCSGCLMLKQARKPFPTKLSYSTEKVLELVYGDLCGPITPTTSAGNKYFFLLVDDDFSRVMCVYMLKSKNEALEAFKHFRNLVEDGDKRRIKSFRTDRGGEFNSKLFNAYCDEAGITRQFTAPYSPQQNGVVERCNMTIVEMARSLLKEKQLPLFLWGEAVRHSIYVLNRVPTRVVSGMTPFEAWSGDKPKHCTYTSVWLLGIHETPTCAYNKVKRPEQSCDQSRKGAQDEGIQIV